MKIFIAFLLTTFLFLNPLSVYGSTLPYFGGLDTAVIPCTGDGVATNWQFFVPLYRSLTPAPTIAGSPDIPLPGPLVSLSTPTIFSNYIIHPGIWVLGTQIPGAGVCLIGVCPYCFPLPNYGEITPFTGESLVPGPP